MKVKRVVSAFALCATVSCAGAPLTAGTAAGAALPECSSTPEVSEAVVLDYHDQWTYTYRVVWCVEGGRIVWAEQDVDHDEHLPTCTWAGRVEEADEREPGDTAWTVFDMSEYTCPVDDGVGSRGVNPWGKITVRADGTSTVEDMGIAE